MNKSKFFSKLNRKGKLILGFMTVAIISPVIIAACGNSQNGSKSSTLDWGLLGEKQGLIVASKLLQYSVKTERENYYESAIFTSIEQMEDYFHKTWLLFSGGGYYYVVPGYPNDNNSKLFFEGQMKVIYKLVEITSRSNGSFKSIQFSSRQFFNYWNYNTFATSWWKNNYKDPQKRIQEDFTLYKKLGLLSDLDFLLAPNNEIAKILMHTYQPYVIENKWPTITGWDS